MKRARIMNRLQRLSSSIPGVPALKRRLQDNPTACGLTYWAMTLRQGGGFKMLMYHRVVEHPDPFYSYAVTSAVFERQLQLFRQFCSVLSLDEVVERLRRGRELPRRCLVLTFDDGYRDTATIAWPLLQRYGLPATVYAAVGAVERGYLWPDVLRAAIKQTVLTELHVEAFPDGPHTFALGSVSDRLTALRRIERRLKQLPNDRRERTVQRMVRDLTGRPAEALRIGNLMCTWDDLRRLAREGMGIGSHTLTHPVLSRLSLAEASMEIAWSRRTLERELGVPVLDFAYPFGGPQDISHDVQSLVRAAGYRTACTTLHGVNQTDDDPYALKRIDGVLVSTRQLVRVLAEETG